MIFGEDFGQLAASGEYEEYKSGTTLAQLNDAIASLSDEEYLDSFITVSDNGTMATEGNILYPYSATTKIYINNVPYNQGDGSQISVTTYYNGNISRLVEITKAVSNGSVVRTAKDTSAGTLTLNSWTLYRRQKGYDVASGGSNVAYAIAPVQTSLSSADKNYAVGEQFLYDGHLYKVTSAITSGAQIVIGTNAEAAGSVMEQLSINKTSNTLSTSIMQFPTITNAADYGSGFKTFYYKIGTKVNLNVALKNVASNTWVDVFTLPASFRPYYTIIFRASCGSSSSNGCQVRITSNGLVSIYIVGTGNANFCFGIVEFDAFA